MQPAQKKPTQSAGNAVALSDVFKDTLRNWPWILLSIAICLGLATFYLLRTPKTYTETAEILIKDEDSGNSAGNFGFDDYGLFQSNPNIHNEMTTIMAKDLMAEVVKRMDLDVSYLAPGTFHKVVAYGHTLPVRVDMLGTPAEDAIKFKLQVNEKGKVTLSKFKAPEKDFGGREYTASLGDTISTAAGRMVVLPTPAYIKGEPVELYVSKSPLSKCAQSWAKRLKVSLSDEDGTVLRLDLSDQSQQRADDVLAMLIAVYNENWIHDKNQIAISTSNFIKDRLDVIESELGNVDSDISSFKSAHLIPDVEAASSMYMNQSQRNSEEILDLSNQLQMTRYIRSYITADGNRDKLLPANTGLQGSTLPALISEYNDKILQRNALVAKSSSSNPLVETLDQQLGAQRQAIVSTIDNQIVDLNTRLRSLQRSEAQTISRIASNPSQSKYLLSVERQQKVKESLYLFLLQKREENELSQAFTAYNTRLINAPGASDVPVRPSRTNVLAIAFLLGLVIPFGVTYVRESSNTRLRGRKDLENLKVPFLGEIPADPKSEKASIKKLRGTAPGDGEICSVVSSGQRDIMNEAFRVLRTNVEFMANSGEQRPGAHVIAVTSFNPHSGKSFIAFNLSRVIALKQKRVLLIDGDMRHASTSSAIGTPKLGIADYLAGKQTDLKKLITQVADCPDLSVLPVGTIPPNPTELLGSHRFGELIDELRDDYDYIFIDCPPIEVVADARIINDYCERTIFVVRAGLLQRDMLPELEKLYETQKYRNISIVLNGTSSKGGAQSYRYGYGYGKNYNYGQKN